MPETTEQVTLTSLAYGGDAVGRLADGRAVLVPFGLPGEVVSIRLTERREHYARGVIVEVLQPSPERVAPRCRHHGVCGGCHYQHLTYEGQLRAKTDILRDQLRRIGHIDQPKVAEAVASEQPWNYRNQVQFHLTPQGKLGFMRAGSEDVLPIEECHLPAENINAMWPRLDLDASAGIQRVGVRTGSDDELMLVLQSTSAGAPELDVDTAISVVHVYEGDALVQTGEDHVAMQVLDRRFRVSPTSFFQVNVGVTKKLVRYVLETMPSPCDTVIDAYCGVGLFSAFLAPRCRRLIAIESSAAACDDFSANLDDFENVELYEDAVERVLPTLKLTPDLVLLDPPRTGLGREVVDEILRLEPETVIYVSCDPATLARDCSRLIAGGYELTVVTPFDMFPQTHHIESVSVLRRGI